MTQTNFANGQIPTSITVDDATASLYTKDTTYPAGETLSAGNVVFVENAPTTAQATSAQNIGDVTANTRIFFPAFGSGASASTLAINLAKNGSPSVNLGVRIETDNAGSPSGILVHANASGTVTAASLTTSLADTTVTLVGAFTIPAGQKCHVVTYQGTYGAETVNASNYYKIGYYTNYSTTRMGEFWNGSAWGNSTTAEDSHGDALVTNGSQTASAGYLIKPIKNVQVNTVTKHASTTNASRCRIFTEGNTLLGTATFSGNVATFSPVVNLSAQVNYRVEIDNSGSTYTQYRDISATFPTVATNIEYVNGSIGGLTDTNGYNIATINTTITSIPFPYTSSTLFQPRVLSKTDADFSYKTDWHGITQEAVTAGDLSTGKYPKIAMPGSIDANQTGMTQGTTMYLSNTPGSIGSSAGTEKVVIGEAISSSKLQLGKDEYLIVSNGTVTAASINLAESTTGYSSTITTPGVSFATVTLTAQNSGSSFARLEYNSGNGWSTIYSWSPASNTSTTISFMVKKGQYRIYGERNYGGGGPVSGTFTTTI